MADALHSLWWSSGVLRCLLVRSPVFADESECVRPAIGRSFLLFCLHGSGSRQPSPHGEINVVHMGDRAKGHTVVSRCVDGEPLSGTAARSRARGRSACLRQLRSGELHHHQISSSNPSLELGSSNESDNVAGIEFCDTSCCCLSAVWSLLLNLSDLDRSLTLARLSAHRLPCAP